MATEKKVWGTTEDGRFELVSITSDIIDECLALLKASFCLDETVSICTGITTNPKAQDELAILSRVTCEDGASIAAIEKSTGKVVAAVFNKVQKVLAPNENAFFDKFAANCKEESSKALTKFMYDMDSKFNTFDHYGITSLLEIMFLFTDRHYRQLGLGLRLCEASMKLAKAQISGEFVLPKYAGLKLGGMGALCTSGYTHKICKKLGFEDLFSCSWSEFSYQGKTFLEIRPTDDQSVLVAIKL